MLSMGWGTSTEGPAGRVYAACIAFAEADQQVEHIMALKEVAAAGTRAAVDAEIATATAWRDVINASMAFVEGHDLPHDRNLDVTRMMQASIMDGLQAASKAAKAKAVGRWHVCPIDAGPWEVQERPPASDRSRVDGPRTGHSGAAAQKTTSIHDIGAHNQRSDTHGPQAGISSDERLAFAVACARDMAKLDAYMVRAVARRRRAWKVLKTSGATTLGPAFRLARVQPEESDGEARVSIQGRVARLVRHDVLPEDRETLRHRLLPRPSLGSQRRKAAPALNALGQIHDHVQGLHLAVYWRYDDLGEPIGRLLAAALAALSLNDIPMARRFCNAARVLQHRRDGFLNEAREALYMESVDKLLEHYTAISAVNRMVASTLELIGAKPGRAPERGGETGPAAIASGFSGTNEPGGQPWTTAAPAASAMSDAQAVRPGFAATDGQDRVQLANDAAERGPALASQTFSGANEPESRASADRIPSSPTEDMAAFASPGPDRTTLERATHERASHEPATATASPAPDAVPKPQQPPAPRPRPHPWEGIVPPERRGAGTMADPLVRPDPLHFMTQSLWVLPGNPTVSGTGLTRAGLPPPRPLSGRSFDAEDLDDDNYEWVPRGEDRIGKIRVRKK